MVHEYVTFMKPLELVGHGKTLTALALGYVALNKLLVSAADDYVIVWDLQKARQQVEKGQMFFYKSHLSTTCSIIREIL
ncbi:hypothetical protein DPMN_090566 [Dreissena polymorpha]|uniref:Uncharacterized protein n=1 Tax=Dreissena polymorpha TaxID=45954 RepID=A0A9D4QZ62_DREPO|nr:hypothetical protein DPMN_090566 [Dreissena polymorpha]